MARYAEWNKFIANLKTDKYGCTDVVDVGIAFQKATADVVPKSEVDRLTEELKTYNRVCGKLLIKDGVVVGMEVGKEVEYINRDIAKIFKQIAVNEAKREVAREIFAEIDKLAKEGGVIWTHYAAAVLAELKKKYQEGELNGD